LYYPGAAHTAAILTAVLAILDTIPYVLPKAVSTGGVVIMQMWTWIRHAALGVFP